MLRRKVWKFDQLKLFYPTIIGINNDMIDLWGEKVNKKFKLLMWKHSTPNWEPEILKWEVQIKIRRDFLGSSEITTKVKKNK